MVLSIIKQANLVLFSLLAGILTGTLFDIYRIIRGFECPNKIITFIEDILFWVFTSITVFMFLMLTNHAYIGGYVYLWIAIGVYAYMKLFSKPFLSLQYRILTAIGKAIRVTVNIITYPLKLIWYSLFVKNKTKIQKK